MVRWEEHKSKLKYLKYLLPTRYLIPFERYTL